MASRQVSRAVRSACGSCRTGGCASLRSQTCCHTSCRGAHSERRHQHVRGQLVPAHRQYSLWELNLSRSQPVSFPMTRQISAASRLPACSDASRRRIRLEITSFWTFGSAKRSSARSLKTGRKQRNSLNTLNKFVLGRNARIAIAMGIRKFRLGEKSMRHRQPLEF